MLVYCCADLIFATRISSTAQSAGLTTRPARDPDMLQARLEQIDDGKANGPVQAVAIDLDLGDRGIDMIRQIKAHDSALPVVCFGSHVATQLLRQASDAGADQVLPRSAFVAGLRDWLAQLADAQQDSHTS